jgi:hypothetical protein
LISGGGGPIVRHQLLGVFSSRSRLYFEYRLCCALNGRRPTSPVDLVRSSNGPSISGGRRRVESGGVANTGSGHDSMMSSALPDELWSDGEEPVAMETYDNDTTQCMLIILRRSAANNQLARCVCSGNSIFLYASVCALDWVVPCYPRSC